ncbi:Ff.00g113800.m01.CDS01 [Fusarium sp. VM40]|nr:Ff.00g113800.m01.CDS01 [Fusarium sp. VM40]
MLYSTIVTGIVAFASAVNAAPAKDKPTVGVAILTVNDPISGEKSTSPLNVPLGVLTHQKNIGITKLEIARVYSSIKGVDAPKIDQITCQMYKDQYGTQPGSAEFTAKKDALISTNTVPLGWVLCRVNAPHA